MFLEFWQSLPSKLDPVFLEAFGVQIRYYGLMYVVVLGVSYFLILRRIGIEERFKHITKEDVQDGILAAFVAAIAGGRLGYVLFYDFAYYWQNPLQVILPYDFATGQFTGIAGMSFHGGLLGVLLAMIWFAKKYKFKFDDLLDLGIPAFPLGYMFGRIGNFLNNELWGRKTDFILGMQVWPEDTFLRHPSQLYEAFSEGLLLFIILWSIRKKAWAKNNMLAFFLIGYGFFRFLVEFVREPDPQLGLLFLHLSMGQYLCLGMILLGVGLWGRSFYSSMQGKK